MNSQPNPGETFLHCGHIKQMGPQLVHFFQASLVFQYRRPNGTNGWCQWIACCERCFRKAGGEAAKVEKRAESVWKGAVPAIGQGEQP